MRLNSDYSVQVAVQVHTKRTDKGGRIPGFIQESKVSFHLRLCSSSRIV